MKRLFIWPLLGLGYLADRIRPWYRRKRFGYRKEPATAYPTAYPTRKKLNNLLKGLFYRLFRCPFGRHWWLHGSVPPDPPWRTCNACGRPEIWDEDNKRWILQPRSHT